MNKRRSISSTFIEISFVLFSLIVLIPFVIVILNSLKGEAEAELFRLSLPKIWLFENYVKVFKVVDIITSTKNGLIYSFFTVVVTIILSAMASFVLARAKNKLNTFCYYLFLSGLILPMSIIPTIRIMQLTGTYGSYIGLIILYVSINIPFAVFLFTGFIKTINREIDEAAIIDGCGPFNLFFRIIFPLLKPVTITAALIITMSIWNEFMLQLYFTNSTRMWSMSITMYSFFGQFHRSWNLVCADIILTCIPVIILFFVFQKHIVSGMVAGAVKG